MGSRPAARPPVDLNRLADRLDSAARPQLLAALRSMERRCVVALDRALLEQGVTWLSPVRKERR